MGTIRLDNVTLKYDDVLLENVTYEFVNQHYIISGKNGSGKTTLIKAITNSTPVHSGKIHKKNTTISYFPQEVLLFQHLTVREFVTCVTSSFNNHLLEVLEMDYLEEYIKNLSMGQVNKTLLYLTLSQTADFYIIDEIINAIDHNVKQNIIRYLSNLETGNFMLVTHDTHLRDSIIGCTEVTCVEIKNKGIE